MYSREERDKIRKISEEIVGEVEKKMLQKFDKEEVDLALYKYFEAVTIERSEMYAPFGGFILGRNWVEATLLNDSINIDQYTREELIDYLYERLLNMEYYKKLLKKKGM